MIAFIFALAAVMYAYEGNANMAAVFLTFSFAAEQFRRKGK
jgi:hypothetical protein